MRKKTTVWAVLACGFTAAIAAPSALAADRCVGAKKGCYPTIQAAVDASHDGDTVRIAAGRYAGGVKVPVSVAIVGAGAGSTVIKGGGPVLTLGVQGAAHEPTISVTGVTITGGVATGDGNVTFVGVGGGVFIPGSVNGVAGATVTIRNSVITGNRASPSSTVPDPCADGVDCPFAAAFGGGIADVGKLTLINTIVSNNVAGGELTSESAGGGIWTATNGGAGTLTLINSAVTGNSATVSAPNGRFSQGAGIFVQDGEAFTVTNSTVSNNTSSTTSSYSSEIDISAETAGIHIGGIGTATIQGSRIIGNTAISNGPAGAPQGYAAALGEGFSNLCLCGQTLVLKDTIIAGNRTIVSGGDGSLAGNVLEIDGPAQISNTVISGNSVSVTSSSGSALAGGAFFAFDSESQPIVMRNSVVRDNTARASSAGGSANVSGAGINNAGALELHNVVLSNNTGTASGTSGSALGGGIWNGMPFGPDGPVPQLLLDNTLVTRNTLSASPGLLVQGGGLYTDGFAVTLTNSKIAHNSPDQCVGC